MGQIIKYIRRKHDDNKVNEAPRNRPAIARPRLEILNEMRKKRGDIPYFTHYEPENGQVLVDEAREVKRFWSKIEKGDCWIWTGRVNRGGFGLFTVREGRRVNYYMAHRVSYQIHKGQIPIDLVVEQTCGVRRCVRPEHLHLTNLSELRMREKRKAIAIADSAQSPHTSQSQSEGLRLNQGDAA